MAETNEIRLMGGKLIVAGVGGFTANEADTLRLKMQDKLERLAIFHGASAVARTVEDLK